MQLSSKYLAYGVVPNMMDLFRGYIVTPHKYIPHML